MQQNRFSVLRCRRRGFSLLELSVVLVILGALTAGGLSVSSIIMSQQANSATNENLDEIQQALLDFVATQGRLPCVARPTVAPTHPDFGKEIATGGCVTGTTEIDGAKRAGSDVWIGAVPTRTLGLKDRMAADEFGNRFLYVVTEKLTTKTPTTAPTTGFDANLGAIGVLDSSGALILDPVNGSIGGAAFMLLSHGPDGKGGVRHATGIAGTPCGTSTNLDVENCNGTVDFRDTRFNNGTIPASFFDDFTRFMPKYRLSALLNTAAGGGGSSLWGNTGDTIYSVGNDTNTTTGNVGIGTTAPTTLLSIGPNPVAALGVDELLQLGRATDAFLTVNDGTARGIFGSSSGLPFAGSQSNHDFVLRSNNLERMRITSAGNVGIGTTTSASRLTVLGEGAGIAQLGGTGCGGDFAGLTLGQTAAPSCNTYHIASSASPVAPETVAGTLFINRPAGASVRFRENNVDQMIITSGGRVGIGYTAPVATLDVNGSIASDQFTIPSDARLKHDIHPVFAGEGLKILAGLQPVGFVWNKNNKPDIGLIAQQVEKALPQAVEKTDNGMLRVTYDKLILPLIAAIQELHEMLIKLASQIRAVTDRQHALEKRLTALEAENAALREEVNTLKAGGKN